MNRTKKGSRVTTIKSIHKGVANSYGEGYYLGDFKQPVGTMTPLGPVKETWTDISENPCIYLDSDKIVWGNQCWWGGIERVKETMKYDSMVEVSPPNNKISEEIQTVIKDHIKKIQAECVKAEAKDKRVTKDK
jgi:hypothetical protein